MTLAHVHVCAQLHIMADATFGSLSVDEVSAAHVDAQCVVHYGQAAMSSPSRLPVLYVFPKKVGIDQGRLLDAVAEVARKASDQSCYAVVLLDLALLHLTGWLAEQTKVRSSACQLSLALSMFRTCVHASRVAPCSTVSHAWPADFVQCSICISQWPRVCRVRASQLRMSCHLKWTRQGTQVAVVALLAVVLASAQAVWQGQAVSCWTRRIPLHRLGASMCNPQVHSTTLPAGWSGQRRRAQTTGLATSSGWVHRIDPRC
jgi:Putative diphthamide synthesis protein